MGRQQSTAIAELLVLLHDTTRIDPAALNFYRQPTTTAPRPFDHTVGGRCLISRLPNGLAEVAARCFPEKRGQLAPGQLADVAIFDYVPTTPLEPGRFLGHLLYGLNYARVHTTIARGRVLMRDSKILTLDEPAICAKARESARGVWKRF